MRSIEAQAATVEEALRLALDQLGLEKDEVTVEVVDEGDPGSFLGIGRRDAVVRVTTKEPQSEDQATETAAAQSSEESSEAPQTDASSADTANEPAEEAVYADEADEDEDEGFKTQAVQGDAVQAWFDFLENVPKEEKTATEVARHFLSAILQIMHLRDVLTLEVWEDDDNLFAEIDGDDCGILIGRRGTTLNSLQYFLILMVHRHLVQPKYVQLDVGGYYGRRKQGLRDLAIRTAERALETGNAYELNPMRSSDRRIIHETLADYPGIITYSEGQGRDRYVVIDLEDYEATSYE